MARSFKDYFDTGHIRPDRLQAYFRELELEFQGNTVSSLVYNDTHKAIRNAAMADFCASLQTDIEMFIIALRKGKEENGQ